MPEELTRHAPDIDTAIYSCYLFFIWLRDLGLVPKGIARVVSEDLRDLSRDDRIGVAAVDRALHFAIDQMDHPLYRSLVKGHIVKDDSIMVETKILQVVHVRADQRILEVRTSKVCLTGTRGPVEQDRLDWIKREGFTQEVLHEVAVLKLGTFLSSQITLDLFALLQPTHRVRFRNGCTGIGERDFWFERFRVGLGMKIKYANGLLR